MIFLCIILFSSFFGFSRCDEIDFHLKCALVKKIKVKKESLKYKTHFKERYKLKFSLNEPTDLEIYSYPQAEDQFLPEISFPRLSKVKPVLFFKNYSVSLVKINDSFQSIKEQIEKEKKFLKEKHHYYKELIENGESEKARESSYDLEKLIEEIDQVLVQENEHFLDEVESYEETRKYLREYGKLPSNSLLCHFGEVGSYQIFDLDSNPSENIFSQKIVDEISRYVLKKIEEFIFKS